MSDSLTVVQDRFGNPLATGLPYARGEILATTEDDFRKLQRAWKVLRRRIGEVGLQAIFNFSGLERSLRIQEDDLPFCDDEVAPALYGDRLKALALDHLGGSARSHDVVLLNRVTAGILAAHMALVKLGDVVIGITPTYSHPSVVRASRQMGARFVDTQSVTSLVEVLERETQVALVVLTRLAVTYDLLPLETIRSAVQLAREKGVPILVDDAGGARVGPAVLRQPRLLELGVDVGVTGLDKYGTIGPRLGLLAGEKSLVARINARAFEFGLEARPMLYPAAVRSLEQYTPGRVRDLVTCTNKVATALRALLGQRVHETPVTAQLLAEDILEIAMERAGLHRPTIVPFEATASVAMLLLEDYGILTVHFAGLPPGTSSLLFKFIPPETLARFGGEEAFANAVDTSLSKLANLLTSADKIRDLLVGDA